MKLSMTDGTPTINAHDLGDLFNIPPGEVKALMRTGEIPSRFETGPDEDAGKVRLTFLHKSCCLRLTCGEGSPVLKTSRVTQEQK